MDAGPKLTLGPGDLEYHFGPSVGVDACGGQVINGVNWFRSIS